MLHFPGIWPRPPVDALDSTGPKMDCVFPCTHIPVCVCVLLSHVWLSAALWTVAYQVLCPWNFPGKNTGVGTYMWSSLFYKLDTETTTNNKIELL